MKHQRSYRSKDISKASFVGRTVGFSSPNKMILEQRGAFMNTFWKYQPFYNQFLQRVLPSSVTALLPADYLSCLRSPTLTRIK